MRRPSLRSQLNQIRLWLRQGRTDAWIAHKLDISVDDLRQFKRDHQIDGDHPRALAPLTAGDPAPELEDLEAARTVMDEEEADTGRADEDEDEDEEEDEDDEVEEVEEEEEAGPTTRRRRGRRGGRGRRRLKKPTSYEGTFDHGDEGYGLWLDPAVADSDVYSEHWAGHREVTVSIEADSIVIRRARTGPDRS